MHSLSSLQLLYTGCFYLIMFCSCGRGKTNKNTYTLFGKQFQETRQPAFSWLWARMPSLKNNVPCRDFIRELCCNSMHHSISSLSSCLIQICSVCWMYTFSVVSTSVMMDLSCVCPVTKEQCTYLLWIT